MIGRIDRVFRNIPGSTSVRFLGQIQRGRLVIWWRGEIPLRQMAALFLLMPAYAGALAAVSAPADVALAAGALHESEPVNGSVLALGCGPALVTMSDAEPYMRQIAWSAACALMAPWYESEAARMGTTFGGGVAGWFGAGQVSGGAGTAAVDRYWGAAVLLQSVPGQSARGAVSGGRETAAVLYDTAAQTGAAERYRAKAGTGLWASVGPATGAAEMYGGPAVAELPRAVLWPGNAEAQPEDGARVSAAGMPEVRAGSGTGAGFGAREAAAPAQAANASLASGQTGQAAGRICGAVVCAMGAVPAQAAGTFDDMDLQVLDEMDLVDWDALPLAES